jgi:hypothetical protein
MKIFFALNLLLLVSYCSVLFAEDYRPTGGLAVVNDISVDQQLYLTPEGTMDIVEGLRVFNTRLLNYRLINENLPEYTSVAEKFNNGGKFARFGVYIKDTSYNSPIFRGIGFYLMSAPGRAGESKILETVFIDKSILNNMPAINNKKGHFVISLQVFLPKGTPSDADSFPHYLIARTVPFVVFTEIDATNGMEINYINIPDSHRWFKNRFGFLFDRTLNHNDDINLDDVRAVSAINDSSYIVSDRGVNYTHDYFLANIFSSMKVSAYNDPNDAFLGRGYFLLDKKEDGSFEIKTTVLREKTSPLELNEF